MEKNKIGVGLITCDRPDFFKKSYASIQNNYDISFVVVDDGEKSIRDLIDFTEDGNTHYIKTNGKEGVGKAKNKALKYLLECQCEHIFLMEDDIQIKDQNVFELYIKTSKSTGIKHLNYGLHGNHNKDAYNNPIIKKTVNYPDNIKIDLYGNLLGAFSYYHFDCLDNIGLIDEDYYNAMEHVDHTYKASRNGFCPPFRWFADAHGADKMLKDILPNHQESKIRNNTNFQEIFKKGVDLFIEKNNFSVIYGYGPQEKLYTEEQCLQQMKNIWKVNQKKK
jgi:GT2 family glycosyltransferase